MNRKAPESRTYEKVVTVFVLVSLVGVAMFGVAVALGLAGLLDHEAADRLGNLAVALAFGGLLLYFLARITRFAGRLLGKVGTTTGLGGSGVSPARHHAGGRTRFVYNRSDCPYGCGSPLPHDLRWIKTPCPGCGRPLYPLIAARDDGWPPAHVPQPFGLLLDDAVLLYVVTDEEAQAKDRVIDKALSDSEQRGCSQVMTFLAVTAIVIVAALIWAVVWQ